MELEDKQVLRWAQKRVYGCRLRGGNVDIFKVPYMSSCWTLNQSNLEKLTFWEGWAGLGVESGDQVEVVEGIYGLELVLIDRLEILNDVAN